MRVERLWLSDFRNISRMELELGPDTNIIYGENGQGKTNLLEAVWLFTGAKSFRGAKEKQMVRFEKEKASCRMDFFAAGRSQEASLEISSRRTAALNGVPLRTAAGLAGNFCAVIFSPAHLSLIKNGPQERRRFIDISICQMKPKYIHILSEYTRILNQRNCLLKEAGYGGNLLDTLDIWDARLASYAAVLIKTRATFLEKLKPSAQGIYSGISREKEQFDFAYAPCFPCDLTGGIPEIEAQMICQLKQARQEELRTRMTGYGPHRDDIKILLDGQDARAYASQGQQRSCVLALKLAECEIIKENTGEYPVVLLDDVMSELDIFRREYLLHSLSGRQLLITCCDHRDFRFLGGCKAVLIANGQIVQDEKW